MADIADLINIVKLGNAEQRKSRKEELEKSRTLLGDMAKEIQAQGGRSEDNKKYNQEQLKIQIEEARLTKSNTRFFSESRKKIKEDIKQQKRELRNTTFLGKMTNSITDAFSPGNKGAEEEKAKEASASQNRILGVLGKISGGITGLAKSSMSLAGKGLKGGIGGLKKLLAGTLFAGLFAVVFAFLDSPAFAKTADFIGNKVLPVLINFYKDVIKPAFDAVVDFLMNDAFPAIGKFMTETVLPILKDFYDNILVPTFGFLIDFFKQKIWPAMKDFISESSGKISEFYENTLKPAFLAIGDFAKNQFFPALGEIFQKLKDTYTKIKPSLDALFNFLKETTLPALFETAKKNFENVKDIVMKVIDFAGNIISGDFGAAFDDLMDIGGLIAKTIDDTVSGILKAVGLDFEGNISDVIGNFFTGIYDSITGVVTGIMDSIEGLVRALPGGGFIADSIFGKQTEAEKAQIKIAEIEEKIAKRQEELRRIESGERTDRNESQLKHMAIREKAALDELKQERLTQELIANPDKLVDEANVGVKGFAKGGALGAGRLALVGENGPELIFSRTDAQVKTSQQTDRLLNAAMNRNNEQSAPVILNAPTVAPQVSNVSNTNAGISYIANPDPIFQRSSAFAI